MLTANQRVRHARHLLLAEIGEQGQAALCATQLRPAVGADPRAAEVAADYLARAGVTVAPGAATLPVPSAAEVAALAGDPALLEAAAALAGAFAAVEAIKATTGAGQPAALPPELRLTRPSARV